ncbi:MAG: DUF2130 domain-containing protein [Saprospirales bacterium]|nr:DUF2130 domain-containing protein [Saprospirales bacterium]
MMVENKIKCPNCGTQINVDELLFHQAEEKLNEKQKIANLELQKEKELLKQKELEFEEKKKKENELFQTKLNQKIEEEKQKIILEQSKNISEKFELELKLLKEENDNRKEENQSLKNEKLELLKKEEALLEKEKNFELKLLEEKKLLKLELESQIKKEKDTEFELKQKEKDTQIESMKKIIDDLKRKSEQGSMQIQGETLELEVESYLKEKFRFDEILEVQKGMRGADCIQVINTTQKQNCGKIIYECKSAKAFSGDWIDKLKEDKRTSKSDIAVLVTTIYPKDIERMEFKDGVWICSLEEFKGLSIALRESIININNVLAQQENKGDKVTMLYDYLTGNDFRGHIEAIVESFTDMKTDLEKEKKYFRKIWSEREAQIDKVVNNTISLYGSIKGIGGKEIMTIKQLELPENTND